MALTEQQIKEILDAAVKRADESGVKTISSETERLRALERLKAEKSKTDTTYNPKRERVDIDKLYDLDEQDYQGQGKRKVVQASDKSGSKAGRVIYYHGPGKENVTSLDTFIEEKDRGKGLATAIYKKIEKDTGKTMKPSNLQTDEGQALWKAESEKTLPKRSFGVEKGLKDKLAKALHSINTGKFWSVAPSLSAIPAVAEAAKHMKQGNREKALDAIMEALSPSGAKGSLWEGIKRLNTKKQPQGI